MIYKYDDYITKYSNNFIEVIIDTDYVKKIYSFVNKIILEKATENHHKSDPYNETKRFTTGFLGEAALEKLFGIEIIDWSIGYSGFYNKPDIPNYSVGIKTVEEGKFPIIFKNNYYPQNQKVLNLLKYIHLEKIIILLYGQIYFVNCLK